MALKKAAKDTLVMVCMAVNAVLEARKDDGKIDKKDLPKLIPLVLPAISLAEQGDQILPDLKAISGEDIAEIAALLVAELPSLKDHGNALPRVRAVINLVVQIKATVDAFSK